MQEVQGAGSLRGLQDKVYQLESSYLEQKGVALEEGVSARQAGRAEDAGGEGSEYSEIVSWIEKSLKNYNSKIADLKKSVAAMSGKSIIFNESRFVQNRLFI